MALNHDIATPTFQRVLERQRAELQGSALLADETREQSDSLGAHVRHGGRNDLAPHPVGSLQVVGDQGQSLLCGRHE